MSGGGEVAGSITVLIADDEPSVRDLLTEIVRAEDLLEVVGVAADAEEAIALAGESSPDVALVDVQMPGGGLRATRGILKRSPRTRVVVLSAYADRAIVLDMLRAGAASYVVKGGHPAAIVEAILRSAQGESILSAEVSSSGIGELASYLNHRDLDESAERLLVERIRQTIDESRFEPVFQPIVDLGESRLVGVEALSRFSGTPAQSPDAWFADAGRVGLRTELELATAQAAAAQFRVRKPDAYLAINLSSETLPRCGELVDQVGGERLVIEITEHAAIDDYDTLRPWLDALGDRGVRLAVDDAGAGFASLRHTLQLSPDFIKLDISLIRGIDADRRRQALATGLIGFADELGAAIIAEGIETKAELETLRNLGVRYGQGYFLGKPGPLPQ
ncbi:MAG: EAL domain-containing protein [Gaiellaceae bacterium]